MTDRAPGTLFVVSTPIGNLGDLTPRAAETLRTVDLILAEDTRHSKPLLVRVGSTARVESHHEHNEARSTPKVVARLLAGGNVALISDAGTPLLSDPGGRLVRAAIEAGVPVVPVPGASALLAALVAGGLAADRFTFHGFVDRKGPGRASTLAEVVASRHTSVLFEAPGRVAELLADLRAAGAGDRPAVVARELTKKFEETLRGTVSELAGRLTGAPPRGEVVVLVGGAAERPRDQDLEAMRARARALRAEGRSARDVARILSDEWGASRNLAYRMAHD